MPEAGEDCFRTILMRRTGRVRSLIASREARSPEIPDDATPSVRLRSKRVSEEGEFL